MKVELSTTQREDDLAWLHAGMRHHELTLAPGLAPASEDLRLAVFARDDDGARLGGIEAAVYWDGVEIAVLWVETAHRRRGIGSALLTRVEAFAVEHGAVVAHLKTVDAVAFCQRHGYEVYGVLEDRPIGTRLHHMKKRLVERSR